jgi:hypothetical protein
LLTQAARQMLADQAGPHVGRAEAGNGTMKRSGRLGQSYASAAVDTAGTRATRPTRNFTIGK